MLALPRPFINLSDGAISWVRSSPVSNGPVYNIVKYSKFQTAAQTVPNMVPFGVQGIQVRHARGPMFSVAYFVFRMRGQ